MASSRVLIFAVIGCSTISEDDTRTFFWGGAGGGGKGGQQGVLWELYKCIIIISVCVHSSYPTRQRIKSASVT